MKYLIKSTFNSLLLLLFILVIFPITALADAPDKNKAVTFKNNKYQICFEKISPAKQQELCKKAGGHLVTITSKEENDFIKMLTSYKGMGYSYFVIGGTDYGHEGKWTWVTGEKWSYQNWAKGEPNNGSVASDTSQDYMYISPQDGLWRDFYGKNYYTVVVPYICEWDDVTVAVTSVSINKTSVSGHVGETTILSTSVSPANATSKSVKWSSSNSKVASVDQTGKVKFLAIGSATITATSVINSSASASCTINVVEKPRKVNGISISGVAGIYPGTSVQLKASVSPSNATNKKIKWSSSNASIATVSDAGLVTGQAAGTVTITASATDESNVKASCKINVGTRIKAITVNTKSISLEKGKSALIKVSISPSNATNKKLKWETGNAKVAKVSSNGAVNSVAPGTTTVTVSACDGSNKKVSIKVTVVQKDSNKGKKKNEKTTTVKPKLYTESKAMKEGDILTLSLAGIKQKNAKWSSSSPKIASVDKNGNVRALKPGSAVITASWKDKKFKCKITVVGNGATKGKVIQEARAYGINGGVALAFRSVKGAKKYLVQVKDSKGKKYAAKIPENKKGSYSGEYDKFKRTLGSMNYWYIKKLGHNYESINPWMKKNNTTYSFKIYARNKKGKTIAVSSWLYASPFNVEKDAPEQNVMLPGKYVMKDPEDKKGKSHGPSAYGNEVVKLADNKKFDIVKIEEKDKKVSITWKNKVKGFVPSSYLVEWGLNSGGVAKKSKAMDLDPKKTKTTLSGLKNEKEYIVSVTAKGKAHGKTVWMKAEEIVVPHTTKTRKAKLSKIRLGDPYSGDIALSERLSKSEAEAFANYGNNGKAFKSRTKYLIWTNLRQIRTYIFTKTKTKEWRLWKDLPCGIGNSNARTNPGIYTLRKKDWIFAWPAGNKLAGTVTPTGWKLNSSSMRTVQFLVYYDAYFCNALHTATYQIMKDKMTYGEFNTAGCIQLDRPWEKWVYDFGIDSTLVVR